MHGVPMFRSLLELVGYEEGADEKGIGYARKKPEVVARSMEEFSKPQYGVDTLKVEVPGEYGIRCRHQGLQRRRRLHCGDQAKEYFLRAVSRRKKTFHLSLGGREQRRFQLKRWSWPPNQA